MAGISAKAVKELRDKSGAGMMDCKKALAETGGDMDAAVDWLRKKGLAAAAKKSGRVAAEGLVGTAGDATRGAVIEVNAETDFVARNETFQAFVKDLTGVALDIGGNVDAILAAPYPGETGKTVQDRLTDNIATIGENMSVRRAAVLEVGQGAVAAYTHAALAPGLGKIGCLVALESAGDAAKLAALAKRIAMHVAAARPEFLTVEHVDAASLERERNVLIEQARASGKPENIIEKMVDGRIRKYYEEVVLMEQTYVIDNETKIAKLIENAAKDVGAPVTLSAFARFELGEGIEKKDDDFAAEVAAAVQG